MDDPKLEPYFNEPYERYCEARDAGISDEEAAAYRELAARHHLDDTGPVNRSLLHNHHWKVKRDKERHERWKKTITEQTPRLFGMSYDEWSKLPWPERQAKAAEIGVIWWSDGWCRRETINDKHKWTLA